MIDSTSVLVLGTEEMRARELPVHELDRTVLDGLIDAALSEDLGPGDVTSETVVPAEAFARGELLARVPGVVAGLGVFARVFERVSPACAVALLAADGDPVRPGDVLARVTGPGRALLAAERTALNFAQRLSGTATATARFVELAAGKARILDTRKTTPGLRALEKYAVRCGGGENHRSGLYDEAMLKDNHLDLAGRPLAELVGRLRSERPGVRVTAEARDESEARAAVRAGADVVMLDNMNAAELARLAPLLREEARAASVAVELEASGGVDLGNVAEIAASGVDRISIGALTHSAPSLDLSFAVVPMDADGEGTGR